MTAMIRSPIVVEGATRALVVRPNSYLNSIGGSDESLIEDADVYLRAGVVILKVNDEDAIPCRRLESDASHGQLRRAI